jgi:hypothetical protein
LDRQKAIESFAAHAVAASAAVTDQDLGSIFGEELARAVATLELHDRERGICASCGGQCCREIGCELFDASAPRCPIHERRSLLCRMHYCERFLADHRELVVALRDVYLACLGDAELASPFPEERP